MRSNLQTLCTVARYNKLRDLVINCAEPQWENDSDILSFEVRNTSPYLDDLNDEQRKAVVRSLCCKDFQMIIGVPGSGK